MKKVLFLFCFFLQLQGYAQSNWNAFKKLECPEKIWVFFHLAKAKKAFLISKEAQQVSDSIANTPLLDGDKSGGQVDAFRHAYWLARLHQEIGKNAAKRLGIAHEKSNYKQFKKKQFEEGEIPDKISSEMDLFNNNVGLSFTEKNVPYPKNGLIYRIANAILAGKLKVIKKDRFGNYLTCNGTIIPKSKLKNSWENNKCMVNSNYKFN
ncbi:MAG: hypothetical protein HWD85_03250 [Flavobacteriaceae bacterium]|nr:hypothetical protein [Flavobacteriaceae bacterium]